MPTHLIELEDGTFIKVERGGGQVQKTASGTADAG